MADNDWKFKYETAALRIVQLEAACKADKKRIDNLGVTVSAITGAVGIVSGFVVGMLVFRPKVSR